MNKAIQLLHELRNQLEEPPSSTESSDRADDGRVSRVMWDDKEKGSEITSQDSLCVEGTSILCMYMYTCTCTYMCTCIQ